MSELTSKSLTEIRDLLASGDVKATDAVQACLDRIEATEGSLNAFTHVQGESALSLAQSMDAAGPDSSKPLWGVPVSIKDILASKGDPARCGSKILENFTPFYDATAVKRLKDAGAIIIGRANMDEFAMGSSTESSAFGPTKNPWNTAKVPGGSSGGSAASVAAGQCFGSLGTDTGGSIRQPASFCGCVGIKPTYGRVSRYGCIAYASSLDQIGPLTRNVPDAALMLNVIAGHDTMDSTSATCDVPDYAAAVAAQKDLSGMTIGMPEEYWAEGLAKEVEDSCRAAIAKAEDMGAKVVPVSLPNTKYAVSSYYIIAMAEASSNLARFDGVRYGHREHADDLIDMYTASRSAGFGPEVKRRIMLGTYVLSAGYYDAYYRKAAQVRRLIRQDFLDAFTKCDLICGPASPVTAWGLNEKTDDPLQMYLMDIYTISLNLAGLPGISIPAGLGADSAMPVGLQLLGPAFGEEKLLAAAGALSSQLDPLPGPKGLA